MSDARCDLAVLGAGPAGAAAALEAASLGLSVVLLDEARDAGGQVFRAPTHGAAEEAEGDTLRAALAASSVDCRFARRVWTLEPGFRIAALGPDGSERIEAATLIVATGAVERHIPTPGWTLPGVFGLAAATILLKAERVLPGRRVVVAGTGPLLYLVAAKILAGGGTVAAVVDARPRGAWLAAAGALAARPDLAARGLGWMARLGAARVPILAGHAVTMIEGDATVSRVTVAPLAADGTPRGDGVRSFDVDSLCLGYGLVPATEATRLLGARHAFDAARGGWLAETDAMQATSLPGVFACGDGAGLAGAAAAPLSGRIAAIGAGRHLGRIAENDAAARVEPLRVAHDRAARFGRAMTALATPPAGLLALMTAETMLCRCEAVTRATASAAIAGGARTLGDLKAATRCGMGPCGGRLCGEAAAMLLAHDTRQDRAAIGPATARPPLRPVPLAALAGAFRYEDLPIPEPAPL
ncbi:NAD(P)/FAD-dependent oxidoreductase [Roseomonas sp. CAU 1739]|uniref:FAD/NAD(P)-dependent oxidoreductase n=1 Tax=Roseomonas sp. CAU 1739 TaxID=3140364 RepID=UPI00325A8FC6